MSATGLVRRDDGAALRALRVGVHPDALVQHVGTDIVARTPGRPDHRDGNVVDLLTAPDAGDVPARLEAVRRLLGPLGVDRLHLRYELPARALDAAHGDDPARVAALRDAGAVAEDRRVLMLAADALPATDRPSAGDRVIARLPRPDGDVITGRRWYAASVLDRYAHGEDVADWRAWDAAWGEWDRARVAALALAGRAEVWTVARHGMPVAALTLLDDADGLAVVGSLVTHPAHRRRGIARALLTTALASLRSVPALVRVAFSVRPGDAAEPLATGLGFRTVADVRGWQWPAG